MTCNNNDGETKNFTKVSWSITLKTNQMKNDQKIKKHLTKKKEKKQYHIQCCYIIIQPIILFLASRQYAWWTGFFFSCCTFNNNFHMKNAQNNLYDRVVLSLLCRNYYTHQKNSQHKQKCIFLFVYYAVETNFRLPFFFSATKKFMNFIFNFIYRLHVACTEST